jgi:dynein heavy chain 2
VEGNKVFFVVEDWQLIEPEFLDMINGLLSTAEVPGLYTPEELEIVLGQIREEASVQGFELSLHAFLAKSEFRSTLILGCQIFEF